MSFQAPLRLRLDGEALVANWKTMAAFSGAAACGAAVKADAYGLGAREVVPRLLNAGCRDFFVAHWSEAEAIADLVPPGNIAVLCGIQPEDVEPAKALGVIPVLNTPRQVALWKAAGGGQCHVMLDSGINRLGLGSEQVSPELLDGLQIDILMSHLASADEDVPQNSEQLKTFTEMAATLNARRRSLANSAGTLLGSDYHFDLTRPGLALYGGIACDRMLGKISQVVHLFAEVLQIRNLNSGDSIGYNATYRCASPKRVATISLGYADGYLRSLGAMGFAKANQTKMPVIGRISMDLITIDASEVAWLSEGDWVELGFALPEASIASGLSQYELLTGLGDRFTRIWT